jgi:HSP20 family protein
MPVFRWGDSWDAFRDLERQVDRLLSGLSLPIPVLRVERQYPPVNIYELPDEFLITAELPGVEPADLDLTVANGVLTLRGQRQGPAGVTDDQFRRHERMWGAWERAIPIPERIRDDEGRLPRGRFAGPSAQSAGNTPPPNPGAAGKSRHERPSGV